MIIALSSNTSKAGNYMMTVETEYDSEKYIAMFKFSV
jgi:hypothetical protein